MCIPRALLCHGPRTLTFSWQVVVASLAASCGQGFGTCQQDVQTHLMSSQEVCLPPTWCLEGP